MLLFDRTNEKPEVKQVKWKRTISGTDYHLLTDKEAQDPTNASLPLVPQIFDNELGDHPDDLLHVIDVPKSLLVNILPKEEDIGWLAHTREYAENGTTKEVSVILGNRLPKTGSTSEVHLVSLGRIL